MKWKVGQTVMVQSRTWANINRPGGCAKITKVHKTDEGSYIEGLDVKYVVDGNKEKNLDPGIVSPHEHLERGGRKRRGRDFLMKREEDVNTTEKKRRIPGGKTATGTNTAKGDAPPAAEAAGKENRSSRQSSATFATPEQPKPVRKPKRVTPIPKIPKMIITGRKIDDVSPLIEDMPSLCRPPRETKKKTVARGLVFDPSDHREKPSKPNTGSKTVPSASLPYRPRLPPTTRRPGTTKTKPPHPKPSALMDKKPAASALMIPPRKNPPPSTTKSKATQKTATNRKAVPLCKGGAATKPRPRHKPTTASFSRVTSAYDKKTKTSSLSETNRKPLLDVYRAEVQKARDFMDEMVGHRSDGDLGGLAASAPLEKKGFFTTKSRYDEFLSHLYKVWTKIDEEEVSEQTFREVFNAITSNSFTVQELDGHIETMCDEGKEVMRSDGMLYRIQ